MHRLLIAAAALLCASTGVANPITVTDDIGREVVVGAPAKRIVSLSPHLTEILFDIGVGDRVVGTVQYSDYPDAAKAIPRVGDAFSVNVESVLALRPDIIFAWRTGGADKAVAKLESLGLPVYMNEAPRLRDIGESVANIAILVGEEEVGKRLQAEFTDSLDELSRQAPKDPAVVFFQITDQNIYTVDSDHLIGQAITVCGGRNLIADSPASVPIVSKEAVIAGSPDVIIMTRVPGSPPSQWVAEWERYENLTGKVRFIDPNLISRPSLRMADGIAALCRLIADAPHRR